MGTVRSPAEQVTEELRRHESVWRSRPLLRRIYRSWHELVASRLAEVPGKTIELGSGIARFKEVVASAIATDVEPTPWADEVVDAELLPYEDASVANLVLIDVFHHVARPAAFLDEAARVLAEGGRVVMLEPYCSPLSTPLYRRFHHERTELTASAFAEDPAVAASPLSSNQARATLVFFRERETFDQRWPELRIIERRRLSLILYPLSGGYSRRPLVPSALYRLLATVERLLQPLAPLAAFRCLVVLERAPRGVKSARAEA